MTRLRTAALWLGALTAITAARTAPAEVVRFEVASREPFAAGEPFGDAGPYERIAGKVHYAIDPRLPANAGIVDLDRAPRSAEGKVELSADFLILAPEDPRQGNGTLLYDVNNRGNLLALRFFCDAPGGNDPRTAADAGNGFLLRRGFTVLWCGWNGEILPGDDRQRLSAPVASAGETITGPVRYEIVPDKVETRASVNWPNHGAYRPTEEGLARATLTWRQRPGDRRVPIPRDQFRLHVTDPGGADPSVLPLVELELPAGLQPGYLYEVVYEARDPLVHGVCFAAVRDLVAALRHGGGAENPLGAQAALERAIGFGVSQSGRFLRELLYSGFNTDERGRRVFDALMPHVAGGGLGSFNHRFAQPCLFASQYAQHDTPSDRFPFAYGESEDPLGKTADGLLWRAASAGTEPLVFHTQSSTEYWTRAGSLVHTDPAGERDAEVPDNVRIFALGGTQHGPGPWPPPVRTGQSPLNPADYRPLLRALLSALDAWCRGVEPPPSVYPTFRDGTLASPDRASTRFPAIPGVRYPEVIHRPALLDHGSRWRDEGIIDRQPPRVLGEYAVRVPRCDGDGNELGCLLAPEVAVPLATFTGWNLRRREAGAQDMLVGLDGSRIPFPRTRAERRATGDPRPSLEERYGDLETYVGRLEEECRRLVSRRYILEEDVERIVARETERARPLFEATGARGEGSSR